MQLAGSHRSSKAHDSRKSSSDTHPLSSRNYPLYPSIAQLLHVKGIPISEVPKIPASGPRGRLLKGDVLAYIGTISSTYSSDQSARISRLGSLDLSNVKPAAPIERPALSRGKPLPSVDHESLPVKIEISIPISLSTVFSVQQRIHTTLGVTLPLATFLARATELANDGLPRSKGSRPTADELFDDVLGFYRSSSDSIKGRYSAQIVTMPERLQSKHRWAPSQDVYDSLFGSSPSPANKELPPPTPMLMDDSTVENTTKLFRVSATKEEEKTARVFLDRIKTLLQVEPGRLVL